MIGLDHDDSFVGVDAPTQEQVHRARLVVVSYSEDNDEALMLLRMLGIDQ